jgi:hypothetical protein
MLMTVPAPGAESIVTWPPALATRSMMETRSPRRSVGTVSTANPAPVSPTSTWMPSPASPRTASQRRTSPSPACWRLLTIACTAAE